MMYIVMMGGVLGCWWWRRASLGFSHFFIPNHFNSIAYRNTTDFTSKVLIKSIAKYHFISNLTILFKFLFVVRRISYSPSPKTNVTTKALDGD